MLQFLQLLQQSSNWQVRTILLGDAEHHQQPETHYPCVKMFYWENILFLLPEKPIWILLDALAWSCLPGAEWC